VSGVCFVSICGRRAGGHDRDCGVSRAERAVCTTRCHARSRLARPVEVGSSERRVRAVRAVRWPVAVRSRPPVLHCRGPRAARPRARLFFFVSCCTRYVYFSCCVVVSDVKLLASRVWGRFDVPPLSAAGRRPSGHASRAQVTSAASSLQGRRVAHPQVHKQLALPTCDETSPTVICCLSCVTCPAVRRNSALRVPLLASPTARLESLSAHTLIRAGRTHSRT